MSNFEFLKNQKEYALFASAAIEAEKVYASAPAMCAVGCRKALELAVKWVYAADNTIQMPYRDNLQSLIHEPSFRFAVDYNTSIPNLFAMEYILSLPSKYFCTAFSFSSMLYLTFLLKKIPPFRKQVFIILLVYLKGSISGNQCLNKYTETFYVDL